MPRPRTPAKTWQLFTFIRRNYYLPPVRLLSQKDENIKYDKKTNKRFLTLNPISPEYFKLQNHVNQDTYAELPWSQANNHSVWSTSLPRNARLDEPPSGFTTITRLLTLNPLSTAYFKLHTTYTSTRT